MKERIKYIDISKAIAMIIIVIGHTFVHSAHCLGLFHFLYSFNVALFFILSGYTFKVNNNFKVFFKKKLIRIMIPYFIWSLLFVIPFLLFGRDVSGKLGTNQSFNIYDIIKNTLYGNGINNSLKQNTSLWFLPALFSMECIYYFIIKITNDKYDYIKFPILILVGFISSKYLLIVLPWGINSVIQIGVGTFYVGYLLSKYNLLNKIFSIKFMPLIFLLAFISSFINKNNINYVDYKYGNYFLTIIIGISISLVIIYISYIINKNKILEYIGINTMGILIFHKLIVILFQTKFGIISKLLNNSNIFIELLLTIIITIASIAISLFITNIIRKILPFVLGENKK